MPRIDKGKGSCGYSTIDTLEPLRETMGVLRHSVINS